MNMMKRSPIPDQFKSLRLSRVVLPAILGLAVVIYLLIRQLDRESLLSIQWGQEVLLWIGIAVLMFAIRHMAYAWRLRILTNNHFSWRKCIELIFIWEFASAVSPTSLGGSATAIILLSQEDYPTAKTVSVILYSVVLDTLFFLIAIPLCFAIYGPLIIRPGMDTLADMDGFGLTFVLVMLAMLIYGSFFFYGLFINPSKLKYFLYWLGRWPFLRRFREGFERTGNEVMISSRELYTKDWKFHLKAFSSTIIGWLLKFLILNAVYLAIVDFAKTDFYSHVLLYARNHTMFAITAFSPTPGGSGVAEILFNGFLHDFIPKEISVIVMSIWRILTYFIYLIAGVLIVPNWINKILQRRKRRRQAKV